MRGWAFPQPFVRTVFAVWLVVAVGITVTVNSPTASAIKRPGVAGYCTSLPVGIGASWGAADRGQLGRSGSGGAEIQPIVGPGGIGRLHTIRDIAAGSHHGVALLDDGTVWAWGNNDKGQLGNGTTTESAVPVRVGASTQFPLARAVAAGPTFSLAITQTGGLWAWGDNTYGQLGNGSTTSSTTPVQVSGLSGVVHVAAGESFVVAVTFDGNVWAWGRNDRGQLGDGTITDRSTPVQVRGLAGVKVVAAGTNFGLALKANALEQPAGGTVWAWGDNSTGQLGDGTLNSSSIPVQVRSLSHAFDIAAGGLHALALQWSDYQSSDPAGTVWAWGRNINGELGNGLTTGSTVPVQVTGLPDINEIAAGPDFSLAREAGQPAFAGVVCVDAGPVWGWGNNRSGQLGSTAPGDVNRPVQQQVSVNVKRIAAGGNFGLSIPSSPPVFTTATESPQPNAAGWSTQPVSVTLHLEKIDAQLIGGTVTYYSVDNGTCGSGVPATITSCLTYTGPFTVSGTGLHVVNVFSKTDGFDAEWVNTLHIGIDNVAPKVTIDTPNEGDEYTLGEQVTADYSCADPLSGIASCASTVTSGTAIPLIAVGDVTFTVHAVDNAGNTTDSSVKYTVSYAICKTKVQATADTLTVTLQVCNASHQNLSSSRIKVTAAGLKSASSGASGPFTFKAKNKNYAFTLPRAGLTAGSSYALQVRIAGDPLTHTVRFVAG